MVTIDSDIEKLQKALDLVVSVNIVDAQSAKQELLEAILKAHLLKLVQICEPK